MIDLWACSMVSKADGNRFLYTTTYLRRDVIRLNIVEGTGNTDDTFQIELDGADKDLVDSIETTAPIRINAILIGIDGRLFMYDIEEAYTDEILDTTRISGRVDLWFNLSVDLNDQNLNLAADVLLHSRSYQWLRDRGLINESRLNDHIMAVRAEASDLPQFRSDMADIGIDVSPSILDLTRVDTDDIGEEDTDTNAIVLTRTPKVAPLYPDYDDYPLSILTYARTAKGYIRYINQSRLERSVNSRINFKDAVENIDQGVSDTFNSPGRATRRRIVWAERSLSSGINKFSEEGVDTIDPPIYVEPNELDYEITQHLTRINLINSSVTVPIDVPGDIEHTVQRIYVTEPNELRHGRVWRITRAEHSITAEEGFRTKLDLTLYQGAEAVGELPYIRIDQTLTKPTLSLGGSQIPYYNYTLDWANVLTAGLYQTDIEVYSTLTFDHGNINRIGIPNLPGNLLDFAVNVFGIEFPLSIIQEWIETLRERGIEHIVARATIDTIGPQVSLSGAQFSVGQWPSLTETASLFPGASTSQLLFLDQALPEVFYPHQLYGFINPTPLEHIPGFLEAYITVTAYTDQSKTKALGRGRIRIAR